LARLYAAPAGPAGRPAPCRRASLGSARPDAQRRTHSNLRLGRAPCSTHSVCRIQCVPHTSCRAHRPTRTQAARTRAGCAQKDAPKATPRGSQAGLLGRTLGLGRISLAPGESQFGGPLIRSGPLFSNISPRARPPAPPGSINEPRQTNRPVRPVLMFGSSDWPPG